VEIETVKEASVVQILAILDFEEIHLSHLGVASSIVPAETGVAALDQLVDSNILDDVQGSHANVFRNLKGFRKTLEGSGDVRLGGVQGVGHFVTQQHVHQLLGHTLPCRHGQFTAVGVEHGGLRLRADPNVDVLGRQKTGKAGRDCRQGVRFHAHTVPEIGPHRGLAGKKR